MSRWSIHNEADNFSVGANVGLALFAANIALWPFIEEGEASGQKILQGAEIRAVPHRVARRRAWRWAAAARLCCIRARCRRMPKPISAWSRSASGWCPAGAAARRCWPAPTRNKRGPQGPIPPLAQVFETIGIGEGVEVGGGSARPDVSAPDRRHHHEPRPAAGRRQGARAGAGQELRAAEAGHAAPARPDRRRGASACRSTICTSRARPATTISSSPASSRRCCQAATPTSPRRPARTSCWRWSARRSRR